MADALVMMMRHAMFVEISTRPSEEFFVVFVQPSSGSVRSTCLCTSPPSTDGFTRYSRTYSPISAKNHQTVHILIKKQAKKTKQKDRDISEYFKIDRICRQS